MFTKFAKAEILGVRHSNAKVKNAKLEGFSAIGKDETPNYRIQDGYIYTKVRAISSRVNKNHDGWPAEELAKAYRTFVGKPIFIDHNNTDPSRARGVVIDARLHVEDDLQKASALDPYYAAAPDNHKPPTWIELLLETDARQFPRLAKAILSGDIDSVSMGANVERTQCNICDNWATAPEEYCDHIHSKGAEFDFVSSTGERTSRRSYEDCLIPGTQILMGDGTTKAIEDVRKGDYVIDHLGKPRLVEKTYERPEEGYVFEIHRTGQGKDRPLVLTGNHPILAIPSNGRKRSSIESALEEGTEKPEYINAEDLREGDWVVEIHPSHQPELLSINASSLGLDIELNEDFGRWCGWYLAEGSILHNRLSSGERSPSGVLFSLHAKETDEAAEIVSLGKSLFGLSAKISYRDNHQTISFYSKGLALFVQQLGKRSKEKALPQEWMAAPISFINGVVSAHLAGDGHHNKDGVRPNERTHVTSSIALADQIYQMNIWLGRTPSRRLDKVGATNKRTIDATHINWSDSEVSGRRPRGRMAFGPWNLARISQIDRSDYNGPVYNLHVSDTHTYVANGQAVHNCYDIGFFEISYVFDPADETALVLDKISKTAADKADAVAKGKHSYEKTALKPQVDLQRSPEEVNTLRQEKVCDLCGNTMEDGKCDVCGYEQPEDALLSENQPPESLADPNIEQAQQNIQERQGELDMPGAVPPPGVGAPGPGLPPPFESRPSPMGPANLNIQSTVKDKDSRDINSEWSIVKNGGLITRIEKPILPPSRITSDKVVNPKPVSKSQKPVESKNKENIHMSNQEKLDQALEQLNQYLAAKTAAEPAWNDPNEHEADLEAVGGEMTGDPEKDTKQEALIQSPGSDMVAPHTMTFPDKNQADPVSGEAGSAGQGPIGVAASTEKDEDDKEKDHEDHEKGEEKEEKKKEGEGKKELPDFIKEKMKDKESARKTALMDDDFDPMDERMDFDPMSMVDDEDPLDMDHNEEDAILDRIRAEWGEEVVMALDKMTSDDLLELAESKMDETVEEDIESDVMDMEDDMGEGPEAPRMANKKAAEHGITAPGAEAQNRVSVDSPLLEEVGDDTQTFGSDSFHITQPVTQEANGNQVGGPIGQAMSKADIKSHIFRALKVAEVEVSLGLIPEEEKYDRAATLEDETPAELKVREETLATVKQANLSKPSAKKVAGRVPSLKTAGVIHSHVEPNSIEIEDSALFS